MYAVNLIWVLFTNNRQIWTFHIKLLNIEHFDEMYSVHIVLWNYVLGFPNLSISLIFSFLQDNKICKIVNLVVFNCTVNLKDLIIPSTFIRYLQNVHLKKIIHYAKEYHVSLDAKNRVN